MIDAPNPTELIKRGQAAARVGRRDEAREILRRAVELAPNQAEAWLELAGVEEDPAQKKACLERVLTLDPGRMEARLGLEMLQRDLSVQASAPPVAATDKGSGTLEYRDPLPDDQLEAVIAAASQKLEAALVAGPPPTGQVPPDDEVLYCANHPDVQTILRCNRCGKPICTRCAVLTPVGYRCKQCVGQQQAVFFTGGGTDYVIGGAIALVLGGIASYILTLLGSWFIALILGPVVGVGVAEVVRLAVRRRRSRYLWLVVGVGLVIASLPALLIALGSLSLWRLVAFGLFIVLAVSAATARLRWG
jgi:hypothetical protein